MEISEYFNKITFHYYHDIWEYLEKGVYPPGATENDKRTLSRLAAGFFLSGTILYKRNADLMLLHYVDDQEARESCRRYTREPLAPMPTAIP
ncbi:hypothetical protein CR513_56255, partial [Mucuna pruriens]